MSLIFPRTRRGADDDAGETIAPFEGVGLRGLPSVSFVLRTVGEALRLPALEPLESMLPFAVDPQLVQSLN
jgi:hypothetical protein